MGPVDIELKRSKPYGGFPWGRETHTIEICNRLAVAA